jgi:4-amino-4-deoxy-L-arabinose transferase-like glycosyltransferase
MVMPDTSAPPEPRRNSILDKILDPKTGPWILLGTAALILLAFPGAPTLWTLEGRSAVICREMLRSGDYFHPYLFDEEYYDKPLVPYWMILGFARLLGGLSETAMRLPGILAGLIAIACTWRIGLRRYGPAAGLTAGWLLATCGIFVYWSRLAGSDLLNLAAVIGAVCCYTERRDRPGFVTHALFFAILAVGAQMKGLIAPVLAVLAILPDLFQEGRWRRHLRLSLLPALIPAALLYLTPFLLSNATAGPNYQSSGLAMAFKENILRFFRPFDHQAPLYVYVEYLPLYALPWTFFLPPLLWRIRRWKELGPDSRWPLLASLLILGFLTLSGSRRNYYVLPILPFVMLAIADWIHEPGGARRRKAAFWTASVAAAGLLLFYGVALPLVYRHGNVRVMSAEIREAAERQAPWSEWRVVLFNTNPQMGYYLDPAVRARRLLTEEELQQALKEHPRTVVVTYARHAAKVESQIGRSAVVRERSIIPGSLGQAKTTPDSQVAFVPQ